MMDIVIAVQQRFGCVSTEAMEAIARMVNSHRVEVESVVTFYSFLSVKPQGKVVIRLCNDIVDWMKGYEEVADAMAKELGVTMGETTADGAITLTHTPCIGMSDQAPAALINDVVVPNLTPERGRQVIRDLRRHLDPPQLVTMVGDGNNAHPLVRSMVRNNIRRRGPVHFDHFESPNGLRRRTGADPRRRGRPGPGLAVARAGRRRVCDRHEVGIRPQCPRRRPVCALQRRRGRAGHLQRPGAADRMPRPGLRGHDHRGLRASAATPVSSICAGNTLTSAPSLKACWKAAGGRGLLGKAVLGHKGFDFDIRIQLGAGAYVCGEETALISSCEGLRGDPRNRPPFPAEKGYLGCPTIVNNVETFSAVSRILEKGAEWFATMGSERTTGTKLLSICGDCRKPGVYEVPFGITARELLEMAEADNPGAMLIGGPCRQMIGPERFGGQICYDDLATGGAILIFNRARNKLEIAEHYLDFFIEESCGHCTPCRVGLVLLKRAVHKVVSGAGEPADLEYMRRLAKMIVQTSRCGLGQAAPNPVLGALENFHDPLRRPGERAQAGPVVHV